MEAHAARIPANLGGWQSDVDFFEASSPAVELLRTRTYHAVFRYLQALGKHNSDVHTPGISMRKFRHDCFILSQDFDKLHSGAGLSHHGMNTRDGSQLTLFVNDVPGHGTVTRCFVLAHYTVIARLSNLGCDVMA